MTAKKTAIAWSVALSGIDGTLVTITAQIGPSAHDAISAPMVRPVGREVLERVRAAIGNSGLPWPNEPVVVTVSGLLAGGSSWDDLAVACAVLGADGQLPVDEVARTVFMGELGLDGHLRPVRGVLPALLASRHAGHDRVIVPTTTLPEAALVPGITVLGAESLTAVVTGLQGADGHSTAPDPHLPGWGSSPAIGASAGPAGSAAPDLADLRVQPEAARALEVAAAGGHHLLFVGLPGTGKSLLARRLPGLLPALTREQALEVTAVHSLAGGIFPEAPLVTAPPFIAPHHSTSLPALVGGGAGLAKPGAISRAHHGVLFLDDICDFAPRALEAVRAAMEDGEIRLARRNGVARYPAQFQLVLATPPCRCQRAKQDCECSPHARRRFLARITGPLLDRIDLRVRLDPPRRRAPGASVPEGSAVVQARVAEARSAAAQRWAAHRGRTNADVPAAVFTRAEFRLPTSVTAPLDRALEIGAISRRGGVRTLRVAWTLADLAGADLPGRHHVEEALQFRQRSGAARATTRPDRTGDAANERGVP